MPWGKVFANKWEKCIRHHWGVFFKLISDSLGMKIQKKKRKEIV